jgi:hypothetical protein
MKRSKFPRSTSKVASAFRSPECMTTPHSYTGKRPRRPRRVPVFTVGRRLLRPARALMLVLLSLAAACTNTYRTGQMAKTITAQLEDRLNASLPAITCPATVASGEQFTCSVMVSGVTVTLYATMGPGGRAMFVSSRPALVSVVRVVDQVQADIDARMGPAGNPGVVSCGEPRVLGLKVGNTLDCERILAPGSQQPLTVTILDLSGSFTYSPKP